MSQKIHIGKNSPAPCHATKQSCKLGQHYDSKEDAMRAYEEQLSSETNVLKGLNRKNIFKDEESTMIVDSDGTKRWKNNNGELHRIDGPAIEKADGMKGWYQNGWRHRVGGPAKESADGSKEYWVNGKRHRVDGPAVERADGSKEYWVEGQYHNPDGPAIERADGSKEYWQNGLLHRPDGPAVEQADGRKEYWIDGYKISKRDFKNKKYSKSLDNFVQPNENQVEQEAKQLSRELPSMPLSQGFNEWNKYRGEEVVRKVKITKPASGIRGWMGGEDEEIVEQSTPSSRAMAVIEWQNNLPPETKQIFNVYLEAKTAKASPEVLKKIESKYAEAVNNSRAREHLLNSNSRL